MHSKYVSVCNRNYNYNYIYNCNRNCNYLETLLMFNNC